MILLFHLLEKSPSYNKIINYPEVTKQNTSNFETTNTCMPKEKRQSNVKLQIGQV